MKIPILSGTRLLSGGGDHILRVILGALLAWVLLGGFGLRLSHPLAFGSDHLFLLLQGRLFLDWPDILRNGHLGFPGRIDLLGFPFSDLTPRLLQFLGTATTGRVFAGAHIYAAVIVAANVGAAYAALFLYIRRPWRALLGALAFATLPFFAWRLGLHDYLAAYYPAPLTFILLHRLAAAEVGRTTCAAWRALAWDPVSLACTAVVATSGIYYSFFGAMLLGVGAAALSLQRRSPRPLLLATAPLLLLFGLLALTLAPFVLHEMHQGAQFPPRAVREQTYYGTRISDVLRLLDPLPAQALQRYALISSEHEGSDFWPGPLLSGFVLLACLAAPALAWRGIGAQPAGCAPRRAEMAQMVLACLCFSLLFTVPWGLGMMFNALVSPLIRAQNRIAPFFAFGAILLALWSWRAPTLWMIRCWGRRRGARLALSVLALLTIANASASLGVLQRKQRAMLDSPDYQQEIASVDRVLAAGQAHGVTTVLQLPIVSWLEQPRVGNFEPYWHMRPFIRSRLGDPLRWSFGLTENSPGFALLRLAERTGERAALPERMACLGFDAVLLERRAYTREQTAEWDATLRGDGAELVVEDSLRRLYRLTRHAQLGCEPYHVPRGEWLPVTTGSAWTALLGSGWHPPEVQGTWGAGRRHRLRLPVEAAGHGDLRVEAFVWVQPDDESWTRRVTLHSQGLLLGEWHFDGATNHAERSVIIPRRLLPERGFATLELEPDRSVVPGVRLRNTDTRLVGVGLGRLRFSPAD
ncbi:hypothetical protein [Plastoroseomonas hellenica]|uniref:hypothetical protein n=1 Tax=Plastoroseomonas hellenica TaxID=2687306 RepID=UPI001BA4E7C6|nr:hypothetical protein [Plastoroseomonas hellenica]MBR0644705.1 hypothetical protein [Plastoroseomonas hellenica]